MSLDNISTEGGIAFASSSIANTWKGRHYGNPVCTKALQGFTTENLAKIRQVSSQ